LPEEYFKGTSLPDEMCPISCSYEMDKHYPKRTHDKQCVLSSEAKFNSRIAKCVRNDTAYKYRAHLHTAKFYLHGANPSLENGLDYIKQHNMIDQWFNCSMNSSALLPWSHFSPPSRSELSSCYSARRQIAAPAPPRNLLGSDNPKISMPLWHEPYQKSRHLPFQNTLLLHTQTRSQA